MYEQHEPQQFPPPVGHHAPAAVEQPVVSAWPKAARITAIGLGAVLLIVAIGAGLLISGARSDADEATAELADVRGSLDSFESDVESETETVEEQIDEMVAQQEADATTMAELQANIDDSAAEVATLTAQLADAQAALDTAQSDLDITKTELEGTQEALAQTQADLAAAEADLDAATSAAEAATAPFTVEPKTIRPPGADFVVVTNKVTCEGFANPESACPATFTMEGRFLDDGSQLFMEFADIAKVPIGTFDGFGYVGEAPVTNDVTSSCGSANVPTTMRVTTSPVQFSVSGAAQVVSATAYNFTWTISAIAASGCVASTRTYTGTITF